MKTMMLVALLASTPTWVQEGEKKKNPAPQGAPLHVWFSDLDANKDGKVTKAELEAYFARLDTDQGGSVSPAEFNAAAANAPGCAGAAKKGEGK